MRPIRCDNCGALSDAPQDLLAPNTWRNLTIERKRGWYPSAESVGANAFRYVDDWPGYNRWMFNVVPEQPVRLDFCSEDCLLAGIRKLHKGAQVSAFEGFTLSSETFATLASAEHFAEVREQQTEDDAEYREAVREKTAERWQSDTATTREP
jgi:hypothetical protein